MSVTQSGPAGYDYQYLASLYIYLHFSTIKNITGIYIDRSGTGDLCLTVGDSSGKDQLYEFECKDRKPGFDEDYFIKCISRFDPKSDDEYVLSNLHSGKIEHFYLFTSSRAEQFSSDFNIIANNSTLQKHTKKRTNKLVNLFRDSVVDKATESDVRNSFIATHLKVLNVVEIELLMDRITIVDQLDNKILNERINKLLGERNIATSVQENLVFKLLQVIKDTRASGDNILERLNTLLNEVISFLPQLLEPYIKIGDEDSLLKELKENQLLLLSGTSLCGKTQRCYYIVNALFKEFPAFQYTVTSDIRIAEQFILSSSQEGRICYLEDPLGQYPGDSDKATAKQLENLVQNLPKGKDCYLICTATTQLADSLEKSGYLPSFRWHDLTLIDQSKVLEIWSGLLPSAKKIEPAVNKLIRETILVSEGKDILQPGQLSFLSRHDYTILPSSVDEIRHLAQFRAQDITKMILKDKSLIPTMEIMAMGATTHFGLSQIELAYMEDGDKEYLPGINKHEAFSTSSSLSGRNKKEYRISEYKEFTNDHNDLTNSVSYLIDLGYLRTFGSQYVFTHPIYQEAARKLWSGDNPIRFTVALQNLRKLIGCLNPKIALHAVKNLYLLFKNVTNPSQQKEITKLGELAVKSTFIVVREEAALFLIHCFEALNSEQRENLRTFFERRIESGRAKYFWQDNIVFVPDSKHIEKEWSSNYLGKKEIESTWSDYLTKNALLPSEDAAQLLNSMIRISRITKNKLTYDVKALKAFLRYDEAFIREDAAYLLAASISQYTFKDLKEIYFENDAFVKLQLIKGLFRSYPYISDKSKQKEIFDFMLSIFDDPFVSFGAVPFFTQFSAGYTSVTFDWWYEITVTARKPMWYLWGELMIVLFKHLPTDVRINGGRFQGTLEEALITNKSKVAMLLAYIGWLKRYYEEPKRSFEMVEVFFPFLNETFSKINKGKRLEIIKQMLEFNNEYFEQNLINLLVSKWKTLHKQEQDILIEKIPHLSDTTKIIAFTNRESCPAVQMAAKGFSIAKKDAETVVGLLEENLIIDILYVNYIDFSTSQISCKNEELWNAVLKYYLLHPKEKAFALAVKVFLDDIFYFCTSKGGLWDRPKRLFRDIIATCDVASLKYIASLLILQMMDDRYSKVGKYLSLLYKRAEEEIQEFVRETICKNLESISSASNLPIATAYISREYEKEHLITDEAILTLLDPRFYDITNDENNKSSAIFVLFAIEHKKVRLSLTLQSIRRWAENNASLLDKEKVEAIDSSWEYFSAKCNKQQEEMKLYTNRLFSEYLGRDDIHF